MWCSPFQYSVAASHNKQSKLTSLTIIGNTEEVLRAMYMDLDLYLMSVDALIRVPSSGKKIEVAFSVMCICQ